MATAAEISGTTSTETEICIPQYLGKLDNADEFTRDTIINNIKNFTGKPMAPNEEFANLWADIESKLKQILEEGLIPADSISSTGLDNELYSHFKMCADTLQSLLFNGEPLILLGNLRGFRRLFSASPDGILKHVFRGDPLEVLKNIYFGGNGVLPEDRMLLADPFHHRFIEKDEDEVE